MLRHSFFSTINFCNLKLWTAISLKVLPPCPQIPRVTVTAECLPQVTDGALAVSGTVADRGKPSSPVGQRVIVLMWFFCYFVLQQKPNHISTDCHLQTRKLQMHRLRTALWHCMFLTNLITSNKSTRHLLYCGSYTWLEMFCSSSWEQCISLPAAL